MSIVDFGRACAGELDQQRELLCVDLDPPPTFTEFPPDPSNPWLPWWAVANGISNTASFLGSAVDTALALRLRGYEANRSPDALREMAGALGRKLKTVLPVMLPLRRGDHAPIPPSVTDLPDLFTENCTLKQFRNPEDPALACYQALVNSRMGVDRVNRMGLLGDINLLRGDSSGGFSVRIHKYDSQPIVQTLGLDVASTEENGDLAVLKPVLPAWMDLDLYYGKGEVICSRAHGSADDTTTDGRSWRDEQGSRPEGLPPTTPKGPIPEGLPSLPLYNTTLGSATQAIVGPFHFPDVTMQVYPLLADPQCIRKFLDDYLNGPLARMFAPGTD